MRAELKGRCTVKELRERGLMETVEVAHYEW